MSNSILIKGVVLDERYQDVLIVDNKIEKIGEHIVFEAHKVIDGSGKTLIPGFVNMHTHAAMTLMRGIGEDMHLKEWLYKKIWPIEQKLDDELVYWGTKLAALEMIKSGTTCFNDQYWNLDAAVKASSEMGIRSVQPFVILDLGDKSRWSRIKEECLSAWERSKEWGPRNRFAIGIHSPYSVSEEMLVWGTNFARERGLLVHIHVSETEGENIDSFNLHGISPTKYLERVGVLGPDIIAAHCLWMDDEDIEIFSKRDVKVVHNINSNLKIASGYRFRYKEFRDAGVTVTLGTDGCASSNNLDMIETMKTTALVQKAWREDPTAMPLDELLNLATKNGGLALGINCGEVKKGALADLSIIDTDSIAFTPNINFKANLVYSANSSCVDTVICDGKILMEGRVVEGEREIIDNVNRLYKKLL
ncbi:MAG: chlorohydrolase [Bacteroidetes bacterium HGW-Bacteroidetes-8]|jgi:5-methylthioadenosine/S-adenosylhomocysteine deaminase|nr:MAG: chlorohydrolase [Bacteroidetes bacterium HGW-Bacteroidetes-8]